MFCALKCIAVFLCFLRVNSQENGFDNFLQMAMEDYPAWVISQGLDPTPISPGSINLTTSSEPLYIVGEINKYQIFNYSNVDGCEATSNILDKNFRIGCSWNDYRIQGEYDVNGYLYTSHKIPAIGSGPVRIESRYTSIRVRCMEYGITKDGYVDLSVAVCWQDYPYFEDLKSEFKNLSGVIFKPYIQELILETFSSGASEWFPMVKHIKEYLTGVFEKTPLSEIIRTTLRPPTTTTPTTPKTTTPPPTCPPCPSCPTATTPFFDTSPPPITCPACPTYPTSTRSPTTISPTCPTPTCPPPSESVKDPKFTRAVFESSLPAWPQRGNEINLGIRASVSDGSPLQYQLISRYPFVQLTGAQSLNFTTDVAEEAHVGPNNVMVMEVIAEVVGDPGRRSSTAVIIVFPKSCLINENDESN